MNHTGAKFVLYILCVMKSNRKFTCSHQRMCTPTYKNNAKYKKPLNPLKCVDNCNDIKKILALYSVKVVFTAVFIVVVIFVVVFVCIVFFVIIVVIAQLCGKK